MYAGIASDLAHLYETRYYETGGPMQEVEDFFFEGEGEDRWGARHVRAALAACPHEHALSRGGGAYARRMSHGEISQRRAMQLPRC
jgi:hypothetical protein